MLNNETPMRALLHGLIDYAGLFPPAGLNMDSAVRNHAAYLAGEYSWMLGRFIVPIDRIEEFERSAEPYFADEEWKVAILGAPTKPLAGGRGYLIDVIERKADSLKSVGEGVPLQIHSYYEIGIAAQQDAQMERLIDVIAETGGRAKIRTGGLTADAFPAVDRISRFIWLCHQAGIPFKATAGLHHPLRGVHPFTYEPDSACGEMHGFLNVFLAAAAIFNGAVQSEAILLLEEKSARAFHVTDDSIGWRSYRFTAEQIRNLRERFAIGFGSCSFVEPVNDLKSLGFL